MNSNQQDKNLMPAAYTPRAWAVLNSMRVVLDEKTAVWTARKAPETVYLPHDVLSRMTLTPRQVEGVEMVQDLCHTLLKGIEQVNNTISTYELDVRCLYLTEVKGLLWDLDERIMAAKSAARRLGIRAVQPKARLAPTKPALVVKNKGRAAA